MGRILLDSAALDDAAWASGAGFVRGITTNPTLLRRETGDPLGHAEKILATAGFGELYYQPTGAYGDAAEEAESAWALDRQRVILKLPATASGAALAATLASRGARVALTAAQSPLAMIAAESIGCSAVIPYLDRALRDPHTDSRLLRALAEVRRKATPIVAASVKSTAQILQAFTDGADAVTAPRAVLEELLQHPASLEAERRFAAEYRS
ncbi:hypothetical protein FZ103_09670 [Streptomonospora sp. PA3]|uniref:transaldolase family protein n=1 Tax=Streptomonospora sp. PA3 TaxID=2607326 RepID=UPI0012DCE00A|nr:transaldolase family protein [Streptomonospora sp. PA3]MUL41438.1 hypothetical protein [Streptomonospora sp. PA3]